MKEERKIDLNNYATCENLTKIGYDLISRDLQGNIIKIQHCLLKQKAKTMAKIEIQSKYVKAGINVQEGDVCIIRSEGKLEPSQLDATKKEWHFDLELPNGEVKDAKFNKASLENLISGFGTDDGAKWNGKEIVADEIIKYAKGAGITWAVKK